MTYEEYFDSPKKNKPYTGQKEERDDYLALITLLLHSLLSAGSRPAGTGRFFPGNRLRQEDLPGYLSLPPFLRQEYGQDPEATLQFELSRQHISERTRLTPDDVHLPMRKAAEEWGLDWCERLAAALALSIQQDLRLLTLCGQLQGTSNPQAPTAGTLFSLLSQCLPENEVNLPALFGSAAVLPLFFLDSAAAPLLPDTPLTLNLRMRSFLLGEDPSLPPGGLLSEFQAHTFLPPSYEETASLVSSLLKNPRAFPFLHLRSADAAAVRHIFLASSRQRKKRLLLLDLSRLPEQKEGEWRRIIRNAVLEVRLTEADLLLENAEDRPRLKPVLDYARYLAGGRTLLLSGPVKRTPENTVSLEAEPLSVTERNRVWEAVFSEEHAPADPGVSLGDLADCYTLPYGRILSVASRAIRESEAYGEKAVPRERLLRELLRETDLNFEGLATLVPLAYTWEDIRLTPAQKEVMETACGRFKMRERLGEKWNFRRKNAYGNGVSLLFYGPPGTGKTMAAQVVANEIGLPLYRVDLSQIFSKYIGETEKNLHKIFEEAKRANVILFFDEADALFSKRTEVESSHDRYSNTETAYLLQKIEEYDGFSILATNYYNNFDTAFLRRLTYTVRFENPDEAERYALWTALLPKDVPLEEEIDFEFLASQFELTGSNIKAILHSAIYMAGIEGTGLTARHVVRAMRLEFDKLRRMVQPGDFGKYAIYDL